MQIKNERLFWPLAVIVTLLIASNCGQPGVGSVTFQIDKVAHFLIFGLLGTLFCRVPAREADRLTRRTALWAFALAALMGLGDELVQATNPERYADVADFAMDVAGAAIAITLYQKWPFYRRCLEATG